MIALMLLHLPLALFSVEATTARPTCQLEILPPFAIEERVLRDFHHRVDEYVRIHRRLERSLPPEHLFADLDDMSPAVDALHDALIDTRPNARAGSIFTPAVGVILAGVLDRAIRDNGYSVAEVLAAAEMGRLRSTPEVAVNGRFPAMLDFKIWPAFLAVLPQLPDELQYRFVGRNLVLVDVHADLIVDILADALPPAPAVDKDPAVS